jgi:Caspase domain
MAVARFVGVGVGEYDKGHLRLEHAVSDVEKVAALLESSFGECAVLRDPVEQEARDCLRGLRDSMSERGGSLVLLWSGHAIPSPTDGLHLLTRDSGGRKSDGLGAGSNVAAPCAESGASQLLLIVDTCFSGVAVAAG